MREDFKKYFEKNPIYIEKVKDSFKFLNNGIDYNAIILYREQGYDAFQDGSDTWHIEENKAIKKRIVDTVRKEVRYIYNTNSKLSISEVIHYDKFDKKIASFSGNEYELLFYSPDGILCYTVTIKPKLYKSENPIEYEIINNFYYDNGCIYKVVSKEEDGKIEKLYTERISNRGGYIEIEKNKIIIDKPFPVNKSFIFTYNDYKKYGEGIEQCIKDKHSFYVLVEGEPLPKESFDITKNHIYYANIVNENKHQKIFGEYNEYTDTIIYNVKTIDKNFKHIITKDREEYIYMNSNVINTTYISDFENPYILDKEWR